jgi:DNA-binding GntR family transcriptional regulator
MVGSCGYFLSASRWERWEVAITPARRRLGRRPQLSDEVAVYIREIIISGRVRPGEYLRLERLAAELGISVTPVREALQSLRSEGFVQLEPRRGFVVVPLSRQDVMDLFWVQATIGGELAARAAHSISAHELTRLDGIQRAIKRAEGDGDLFRAERLNQEFHRAVSFAGGDGKLAWLLGTVAQYVPAGIYGEITNWATGALADHKAILDALHAEHSQAASAAMHSHIVHIGEVLIEHLEQEGVWPVTADGHSWS